MEALGLRRRTQPYGFYLLVAILVTQQLLASSGPSTPAPVSAQASTYVREDPDFLYAGNSKLELVFQRQDGRLYSIVDKASGHDYMGQKDAYWSLYYFWATVAGNRENLFGGRAGRFSYQFGTTDSGIILTLYWDQFWINPQLPLNIGVCVSIELRDEDPLTYWKITITNGEDVVIDSVDFPAIYGVQQIGGDATKDYLVYPSMSGLLFQDPLHNFFVSSGWGWEMYYPSAYSTMQFMAYYSQETRAGLYIAAYDSEGHSKFLHAGRPAESWMSLSIIHILPFVAGLDYTPEYPVVVGVFSGDWYDAAQIYRRWALEQPWAVNGRLAERSSTPDWFKNLSLHQWVFTYPLGHDVNHFSIVPEVARDTAGQVRSPVAIDWIGWERNGWYIDYPDVFPPKEGWTSFESTVTATHESGNYVQFIPNTTSYSTRLPTWPEAQPYSIVTNEIWRGAGSYPYEEAGLTTTFEIMCPSTTFWRTTLNDVLLGLGSRGADIIQLDGFPVFGPQACVNNTHGHVPGGGNWWFLAYKDTFETIKTAARELHPELVFSAEGMAEAYLSMLDCFWDPFTTGWSPNTLRAVYGNVGQVQLIPLWHAVYHDYAVVQSGISFASRNAPSGAVGYGDYRDYYVRGFGLALVWGEVPTIWYSDEKLSELNEPEEREMANYLTRIIQARSTRAKPFLVYGRMLRPPDIQVPLLYIAGARQIPYTGADHPPFYTPSVLSSAWRAPSGDVGFIFTNISQQSVSCDLTIDPGVVDAPPGGAYVISQFLNGEYSLINGTATLPFQAAIRTEPLDVLIVTVSTGRPELALSSTGLTFGPQVVNSAGVPQTLTLTNIGSALLNITSISISGDFAQTNTCITSLPPGANCTSSVTFTPTAPGDRSDTLTITDDTPGSPHVVTLSGTGQDFSLTATSSSATITAGQAATYTVGVTPAGGFNQLVALSCSGAPSRATCSISPASVTPDGTNAATATVTLTTTARSMVAPLIHPAPPRMPEWAPGHAPLQWPGRHRGLPLLLCLLALLAGLWAVRQAGARVKSAPTWVLAATLLLALMWVACGGGGGGGGGGGNPGTPTGTYTLTVTGTYTSGSSTLKHDIKLTLTVS